MPAPEENNSQTEQSEQEGENRQETSTQQAPPTDYEERLRLASQFAQSAAERERRANAELDRLRNELNQRDQRNNQPAEPSEEEMNELFRTNPARAMRMLTSLDTNRALAPLVQQVNESTRERNLTKNFNRILASKSAQFPQLSQAREQLLDAVAINIGPNGEPSESNIELAMNAIIGDLAMTNPQAFMQLYQQPTTQPNNVPSPNTPKGNFSKKEDVENLPPRTNNGRPLGNNTPKIVLNETEKELRKHLDPNNEMSDQEFREALYAEDSVRNYNLTSIARTN